VNVQFNEQLKYCRGALKVLLVFYSSVAFVPFSRAKSDDISKYPQSLAFRLFSFFVLALIKVES
jgi:hypothetical protein